MLIPFLIFLAFLLPLIIGIFVFDDMIIALVFFVLFWGVVIGIYYLYTKTPSYQKKKADLEAKKKELESLVSFNKETGVLTLHKRSALLANLIKIQESNDIYVKYEPIKLHVGAATVGGVTTGGAYTTGGYNYISAEKKNGLCSLRYGADGELIRKIQLVQEDYQEAVQSIIVDYLNAEKQQIDVVLDIQLDEFERMQALANYKTQGYVGNKAAHKGYPTLEKGLKIMDWLTTEN